MPRLLVVTLPGGRQQADDEGVWTQHLAAIWLECVLAANKVSVRVWGIWQPGHQEEKMEYVRNKTGSDWEKRVQVYRMQNSSVLVHELWPIFGYLHYSTFFPPQLKRDICSLGISPAHSTFLTNHRRASCEKSNTSGEKLLEMSKELLLKWKHAAKVLQRKILCRFFLLGSGGSTQHSAVLMLFTNIDPWKVTAEQFEATCEAWWPGLSLFIQNRFSG